MASSSSRTSPTAVPYQPIAMPATAEATFVSHIADPIVQPTPQQDVPSQRIATPATAAEATSVSHTADPIVQPTPQIVEDAGFQELTRQLEATQVEIERQRVDMERQITQLVFAQRSVEEHRQRADALQDRLDRAEEQVGLWRTAAQDLDVERRIAYFRAEHYMRIHAYISRAPESHRVQPSIPLYPWLPDSVLSRRTLSGGIATSIADCDICIVCQETFDSFGWYTLGCGHRFHLYCIVHHMCRRSSCPMCRVEIDLALYRMWGIGDLFLGRGETIDPVTRLPLGVDLES